MKKQVLTRLVNNTSSLLNTIMEDTKLRNFQDYNRFKNLEIKISDTSISISFRHVSKYIDTTVNIFMNSRMSTIYITMYLYKIHDLELKKQFTEEIMEIAKFLGYSVSLDSENQIFMKYDLEV